MRLQLTMKICIRAGLVSFVIYSYSTYNTGYDIQKKIKFVYVRINSTDVRTIGLHGYVGSNKSYISITYVYVII